MKMADLVVNDSSLILRDTYNSFSLKGNDISDNKTEVKKRKSIEKRKKNTEIGKEIKKCVLYLINERIAFNVEVHVKEETRSWRK